MKNFFKFFNKNSPEKDKTSKPQTFEVKQAANKALKQYDKTFKDLARYDKGERILNAVPR